MVDLTFRLLVGQLLLVVLILRPVVTSEQVGVTLLHPFLTEHCVVLHDSYMFLLHLMSFAVDVDSNLCGLVFPDYRNGFLEPDALESMLYLPYCAVGQV